MMLAMLPAGTAQLPSNEWEFGWDTEVEPSYDLSLDGEKWKVEATLVYFVDNPRINDLNLLITVEFEDDVDVLEATYEESITVSAQTNETFMIELSTSDAEKVRAHSPDDKITILVRAEQEAGGAPVSPKEIDAKLNVPRYHKLVPEVNLVASSVDARTFSKFPNFSWASSSFNAAGIMTSCPTCQSAGVATPISFVNCKASKALNTSAKFLPTVIGYVIVSLSFLSGPIINTDLTVAVSLGVLPSGK